MDSSCIHTEPCPFRSMYMRDFPWPLPKPICTRPAQPALATKAPGYFMFRPLELDCPCDNHPRRPLEDRYAALANKECNMLADLCGLRKEMTYLNNKIMEHRCDGEEQRFKSVYMADYLCAGVPVVTYGPLKAAVDSPVGVPIPPARLGVGNGFRDPCSFRHPPHIRPTIDPARPLCMMRTPVTVARWLAPFPGKSEYQDRISRIGGLMCRCQQQFREPLPSTRRHCSDPCS